MKSLLSVKPLPVFPQKSTCIKPKRPYISVFDDSLPPSPPLFQIGDNVRVLKESHGWGKVKRGDVGIVACYDSGAGIYSVDFAQHRQWKGTEDCFIQADMSDVRANTSVADWIAYMAGHGGNWVPVSEAI